MCQVVDGTDLLMAASDGGLSDSADNRIGPEQSPNSVIKKSVEHLKGLLYYITSGSLQLQGGV